MSDSTNLNFYLTSSEQIRGYIVDGLFAGLVPLTNGSRGVGRSRPKTTNKHVTIGITRHPAGKALRAG